MSEEQDWAAMSLSELCAFRAQVNADLEAAVEQDERDQLLMWLGWIGDELRKRGEAVAQ